MKKILSLLLITVTIVILVACIPPTPAPTPEPTAEPTAEPTDVPPTPTDTPEPTVEPTEEPGDIVVEEPFVNKLNCPSLQCNIVDNAPEGWRMHNNHPETGDIEVAHVYDNPPLYTWHVKDGWRTIGFFNNGRPEADDPKWKGMSFEISQRFKCSEPFRCLQKGVLYAFSVFFYGFAGDAAEPGTPGHEDAEIYVSLCVNTEGRRQIDHDATFCTLPYSNMLRGLYNTTIYDGLTPINDVFRADDLYDRIQLPFVASGGDVVVFVKVRSQWAWGLQSVTLDQMRVEAVGVAEDYGY